MSLVGVKIKKGRTGPNISGKPFKTSGIITTGVAVAGMLDLGVTYTLTSVDDAAALGLDSDYDTTNNVVVFEHISEFFRMAQILGVESAKLYLMVIDQAIALGDMIDDVAVQYAKKLIVDANGEIYNLAIGFNPPDTYTETAVDGLNSDVRAAIVKAQALWEWTDDTFRPAQILLEGRGFSGTATASLDLRNIPAVPSGILEADKVSIVIGQDFDFAETLADLAQKHAAIGTALGTLAACEVNQSIAEVESFNLSNELKSKFTKAGLSSHVTIASVESQLATLDTKGYIFPMLYTGISGYRWNNDPTCTPVILDADGNLNENTIGYGRTMDYSKRRLRQTLLPLVKKVKPVDPSSGKMPTGVIKDIEQKGNDVFEDMVANGWLSGGKTTVDPDSDILVEKVVYTSFGIVPYGTIGEIQGTINLKTHN